VARPKLSPDGKLRELGVGSDAAEVAVTDVAAPNHLTSPSHNCTDDTPSTRSARAARTARGAGRGWRGAERSPARAVAVRRCTRRSGSARTAATSTPTLW